MRGFLAGVVRKNLGLNFLSDQTDKGRIYRIKDGKASPVASDRTPAGGLKRCGKNVATADPKGPLKTRSRICVVSISADYAPGCLAERLSEAGPRSSDTTSVVFGHRVSAPGRSIWRSRSGNQASAGSNSSERTGSAMSTRLASFDQKPTEVSPGTILVREWDRQSQRVSVTADGFAFEGKTFDSLSKIAFAITGTNWNGPRFFGLRAGDGRRPNMKPADNRVVRCAIYTRVSTELRPRSGLQLAGCPVRCVPGLYPEPGACGWRLSKSRYDDGGFSGGSTDRPALQRLLADVKARRIHVIVVYKVDRLTRSLADFAKLVELFDAHGVSFVSVTQQFNTTTSMGRLDPERASCRLPSLSARSPPSVSATRSPRPNARGCGSAAWSRSATSSRTDSFTFTRRRQKPFA